jgi:lipopolysaccharide/colanic/teichoic acid biosynthesis glycosyltransferase
MSLFFEAKTIPAITRSVRAKRRFDVLMCALTMPILLPLFALIAGAILLADGRPVLFLQQRVGRARNTFCIYKFRTMRAQKVTRMGRFLRATGLDETAQWCNVWRGEMSWIGPRPLMPADLERLGWDKAAHDLRFSIAPGMTGLAQLYGGIAANWTRGMDRIYRRKQCLRLDLWIALLSLAITLLGKRRVRRFLLAGSGKASSGRSNDVNYI